MATELDAATVRQLLDYDADTGILRWRVSRGTVAAGSIAGSLHKSGCICISVCGRVYKAHRLAWLISHGEWPAKNIDHINRERADNRLANLRLATIAENAQNLTPNRKNASAYGPGVSRGVRGYRAKIGFGGRDHYIGHFDTPEKARAAYAAAKARLHTFATEEKTP